ncbi:MAG: hypothetical protein NC421_07910 [Lachnospiraceae bacterium]|nr:hypothetical protein [Lachnospiraceae bacterium]
MPMNSRGTASVLRAVPGWIKRLTHSVKSDLMVVGHLFAEMFIARGYPGTGRLRLPVPRLFVRLALAGDYAYREIFPPAMPPFLGIAGGCLA